MSLYNSNGGKLFSYSNISARLIHAVPQRYIGLPIRYSIGFTLLKAQHTYITSTLHQARHTAA